VTAAGAAVAGSFDELEPDAPVSLDVVESPPEFEPDAALATAALTCVFFAVDRAGSRPAAICT